MEATDDRRKASRAPLDAWVEITAGGVRRRTNTTDLSGGGLGFTLGATGLTDETRVTTEFPLPGISLPVELAGVVVWTDADQHRAGLRFVDLDPGIAELLESFVAGRLAS